MTGMDHAEFVTRTQLACARAGLDLGRAYNPAELRDRRGRWARGGLGGGSGAPLPWKTSGDVAHYTGSLGIAREDMPQLSGTVNGEYRPSAAMALAWKQFLKDRGVTVRQRTVPAETLKPAQATGDMRVIRSIAADLKSGKLGNVKPVTVSADGRVLDGHHNWAAKVLVGSGGGDSRMPVNQVDVPAARLLELAREFAASEGIAPRKTSEVANPAHKPGPDGLTDAQYLAHTVEVEQKIRAALAAGSSTDARYAISADRGIWAPERARLHKQIVNDLYRKQAAGVPAQGKAVIAGGLGGAGKTTVLTGHAGIDPGKYVTLNPDDVKEEMARRGLIPDVPGLSPMEAAALVHEESSHITNLLAKRALMDHKNVIWDITMSRAGSVKRRIDELRAAGYRDISGVFVDIPAETSVERALARHRRGMADPLGGRYVPPAVIRKAQIPGNGTENRRAFDQLRGQFSRWAVYDNSGAAPKKVASGL